MVRQSGGTLVREVSVLEAFRQHKDLQPEGIAELNEAGLKLARVLAEEVVESLPPGASATPRTRRQSYLVCRNARSASSLAAAKRCRKAPWPGWLPCACSTSFAERNAPGIMYLGTSPTLHYDPSRGTYVGGLFWDGKANSLAEQAKGPFLNPLEMNMPSKAAVVAVVQNAMYASKFISVYGPGAFGNVDTAFDNIADAVAVWEESVNPSMLAMYSSRYDAWRKGTGTLTEQELHGMSLFAGKGKCTDCHSMAADTNNHVLFTDFSYHNLGLPKNPANPFYTQAPEFNPDGMAWIDKGLGEVVADAAYNGFFKTPTLRNIAASGPYGHNGVFRTLDDVIRFMNTRDVSAAGWPPSEVGTNRDTTIGDLGLTDTEVEDIRMFLGALTDMGARITGDIDADGHVDVVDLLWFVDAFGTVTGDPKYNVACDLDTDGTADIADLLILASNFGM